MFNRQRNVARPIVTWCTVASCVFIAALTGCGGAEFGQDPRVPVSERHILAAGSPAGASLSLPTDRPFNIHVKQSSQDQGPAGKATSEADATTDGKAFARANASQGGSAKAEFKIGHRIDNTTATTQTLSADISFNLRQEITATDVPAPATVAKADLVLVVIDSHRRAVSKTIVVQGTSDDASGQASIPQQRHLTVRLEPGESYDVVLFGTVDAAASESQQSAAKLEIDSLKMALSFAPTATQPAATPSPAK